MEIKETLKNIISEAAGVSPDKVSGETHFQEDLNLSNIELAELLNYLEEYFKINLHKEDIKDIETVADLQALIEDKLDEI